MLFLKGRIKMKEFTVKIKEASGIHARPAGLLVKEASGYDSNITITVNDKVADGKRIFSVMSLAAKYGDLLKVTIDGNDEEKAAENLKIFFKNNL